MTQIIDGKAFSAKIRDQLSQAVTQLKAEQNITPGLAVVLVGNDAASEVYVRNKRDKTEAVGMQSFAYLLPESTSQQELLKLVHELNDNSEVHGILVQLPLPIHIDADAVIQAIEPTKDVDGFHAMNVGKLGAGLHDALVPCTPQGSMLLIEDVLGKDLSGQHAAVIGRSNIVGKPMAQLLLQRNATVSICHSRTRNIEALCAQADILVAAVGKPNMVGPQWVKEGAVVIDVGINRIDIGDGKTKLIGDVDFDAVKDKTRAITPVPGGVGPMTIACLLRNTLQATCHAHQLPFILANNN